MRTPRKKTGSEERLIQFHVYAECRDKKRYKREASPDGTGFVMALVKARDFKHAAEIFHSDTPHHEIIRIFGPNDSLKFHEELGYKPQGTKLASKKK